MEMETNMNATQKKFLARIAKCPEGSFAEQFPEGPNPFKCRPDTLMRNGWIVFGAAGSKQGYRLTDTGRIITSSME